MLRSLLFVLGIFGFNCCISSVFAASVTGHARVIVQESLTMTSEQSLALGAQSKVGKLVINGPENHSVSVFVTNENPRISNQYFKPKLQSSATPVLNAGRTQVLVDGNLITDRLPKKDPALNHSSLNYSALNYVVSVNYN